MRPLFSDLVLGCAVLLISCAHAAWSADVTIIVRDTDHNLRGENTSQTTYYLTAERKRVESAPGSQMVEISDCKTGQEYHLDLDARTYTESVPGKLTLEQFRQKLEEALLKSGEQEQQPTSTVEVETTDTGERQDFFGYTARHVVTTRRQLLQTQTPRWEGVWDGWYIDLPVAPACKILGFTPTNVQQAIELRKHGTTKYTTIGKPEIGYPVKLKITQHILTRGLGGSRQDWTRTTQELEVIELSGQPLPKAIFDVPQGFKRVRRSVRNSAIPPELLTVSINETE